MTASEFINKNIEKFPTVLIIFGATGDLMERKLLPALFHLHQKGILPKLFQVIGFSRQNLSNEEYREWIKKNLPKKAKGIKNFLKLFVYQAGLFEQRESYNLLAKRLGYIDGEFKVCANKLFYLAVPPNYYEAIFQNLADSGLTKPCSPEEGWTRVLVEKPFGQNLEVAEKLDKLLGELFKEIQVYRIDHYLAKETILNLLVFRFSNTVFENLWNKKFIEKIEITLLEKEGAENRAFLYDGLGALVDVGQNHLLQMLALVTMDPPMNLDAELMKERKIEILKALSVMSDEEIKRSTIRGQYKGYTQIAGISPRSQKETYFKIKTYLKHPRWEGVPVYLESGKKMKEDLAEIRITFKPNMVCLFCPPSKLETYKNTLSFQIKPTEGIIYSFFTKKPGFTMDVARKELHFFYEEAYRKMKTLPDYERLLIDAFAGDQTLFLSTQEILASWHFVDAIRNAWNKNLVPLKIYPANSMGPKNGL